MTQKLSITDVPLRGKRVLMRVDFNVPMDKQGNITDDTRIKAALPSINYILEQGGSLVLMSHLGRPKDKPVPEMSLKPCAKRLSELLKHPVAMAPDCVGDETEKIAFKMSPGDVLMLENLRFHRGEEHPEEDSSFVAALAKLGDVYINDAFGTAHREHASTASVAKLFPNAAVAGFLMEKEIRFLGEALSAPKRPFYAIIGGAKISTKIGVIKALLKKVDALLIGGGMAYTFYKAEGIGIGGSIHEDACLEEVKEILNIAKKEPGKLVLPQDNVIADALDEKGVQKVVNTSEGIPDGFQGVDIGPQTIQEWTVMLKKAGTVLWNGPLGVFEIKPFAKGTNAIAAVLAESTATTIVGGGDSIAALNAIGAADKMAHISTGGGASLEYIELGTLPGVEALSDRTGSNGNR